MIRYTCPCCGYKTLSEEPYGTHEICTICFWEDDKVQFEDPDHVEGTNSNSLRQAQKNFEEFGASERKFLKLVRKLNKNFVRDENWRPVS